MNNRANKVPKDEQYQDNIARLMRAKVLFENLNMPSEEVKSLGHATKTITFQITESCNLKCTYCYQINKSKEIMSFETAKNFIEFLIKDSYNEDSPLYIGKTKSIIIEFIGGEPLLEIDLINDIYDYLRNRLIEERHPWAIYHVVSMISNGVKYMEPSVQDFLQKNNNLLSFNISLDGNKFLHDSCRIFPDGTGSYDIAKNACLHYMNVYNRDMKTKMTLAPENIIYLYDAITNLIDLGYTLIHSNCVYEDVWDKNIHPRIFYDQLIKLADYLFDNNLIEQISISLFDELHFKPCTDDQNYCGSNCAMLAINNDGEIYPCIRFMKSSLGNDIQPYSIGTIKDGLGKNGEHKKRFDELYSITRTSQSDEKCNNCPISSGCGWCSGYNYQVTGSVNKRIVTICEMHQARCLANVYYWNKFYKAIGEEKRFAMNIPKEWALEIISEEEYNMLLEMSKGE